MENTVSTSRKEFADINRSNDDLEVLNEILTAFRRLEPGSRERVLNTVASFLGLGLRPSGAISTGASNRTAAASSIETAFSEDRSVSPKQFMLEKEPQTDVEKVACLAFYLTHYQGLPHFKILDISKLNTEAAQAKFANAGYAVDIATKRDYLVPLSKGSRQLSALGEQFVLALPDREKARSIMAGARPRRKARNTRPRQKEDQN